MIPALNPKNNSKQLIILAASIFIFRIVYVDLYKNLHDSYGFNLSDYITSIVGDYPSLIAIFLLSFLFVYQINKKMLYGTQPLKRIGVTFLVIITISIVVTIISLRPLLFNNTLGQSTITWSLTIITFLAAIILAGIVVIIMDLLYYLRKSKQDLIKETNKKRKAQYQYNQLKGQLNPHFLFNSLNILDYLVQNNETERASDFISKLAGTYRYFLNKEDKPLVTLLDELTFVEMYTDLLKERFTTGLIVEINIKESVINGANNMIVPCGLQLLVENAIKHNIVSTEQPLTIKIEMIGEKIAVSNNIQPKIGKVDSMGVGLSNIKAQYKDIADKEIIITHTKDKFLVELPLCNQQMIQL